MKVLFPIILAAASLSAQQPAREIHVIPTPTQITLLGLSKDVAAYKQQRNDALQQAQTDKRVTRALAKTERLRKQLGQQQNIVQSFCDHKTAVFDSQIIKDYILAGRLMQAVRAQNKLDTDATYSFESMKWALPGPATR